MFTPTSDAKQLEFSEDRGPKISKGDIQSKNSKKFSDSMVREPASDGCLPVDSTVEKHLSEALISDTHKQKISIGDGLKEDKVGHQVPVVPENLTLTKTIDAVASLLEHNDGAADCEKKEVRFIDTHLSQLLVFIKYFVALFNHSST